MKTAIGVDIGGSNVRMALVSSQGEIVRAAKHKITDKTPAGILHELANLKEKLDATDADLPMAIGIAAFLRLETGTVVVSPNLKWHDVPFGQMLNKKFNREVRLLNDLSAIAIGEAYCGAGERAKDVICVFVGTGVGMGAVVQGKVLEGNNGFATEFGHIKIASVVDGRKCGCGERGCLEAYTSGRHLPEILAQKIGSGKSNFLLDAVKGDLPLITADRIEKAAASGDATAQELWSEVASQLGISMGNLLTIFNPKFLVLGGGVLESAPLLRKQVVAQIKAVTSRPQLGEVSIVNSKLGDQAGVVGAGLAAHGVH